MAKCTICAIRCVPTATNAVGVEIQEFARPEGWVGKSKIFKTFCEASKAMAKLPKDGIERRIYTALGPAIKLAK